MTKRFFNGSAIVGKGDKKKRVECLMVEVPGPDPQTKMTRPATAEEVSEHELLKGEAEAVEKARAHYWAKVDKAKAKESDK